jgi:hypothetical protein
MKKKIYYVNSPYYGDGEHEIEMDIVDANYELADSEFNTLEDASKYVIGEYENYILKYQKLINKLKTNN